VVFRGFSTIRSNRIGFTEYFFEKNLVLLGFTGFYLVLLGFTGFYLVLLGFDVFQDGDK